MIFNRIDLSKEFHPVPKPGEKINKEKEKTNQEKTSKKIDTKSRSKNVKKAVKSRSKNVIKKKNPIKGEKHKQTKAKEVTKKVKNAVWERDKHRCIFCGKEVDVFYANAHFIPRSAGGLGIEENIFTACKDCHIEQDNGKNSKEYDQKAKKHLKSIYGAKWKIEKLIYKK